MQIKLNQGEIEHILRSHFTAIGLDCGQSPIEFTAGRGESGMTAEIQISDLASLIGGAPVNAPKEAAVVDMPARGKPGPKPKATVGSAFAPKQVEEADESGAVRDTVAVEAEEEATSEEAFKVDPPTATVGKSLFGGG